MKEFRIGLICIMILISLTQLSITVDFYKTKDKLQKLQDSTNLIINRTDTILTILQD